MDTFKDMLAKDLDEVFFNLDEFADEHSVEGKKIKCTFDSDALQESKAGSDLAIAESSILLFAKTKDLPKRKSEGATLNVDGREYIVDSWHETNGMASIFLSQNRTRGA